jgi:hypothetical protein
MTNASKVWSGKIKEAIRDNKTTLLDLSRQDWVQWHVFVKKIVTLKHWVPKTSSKSELTAS